MKITLNRLNSSIVTFAVFSMLVVLTPKIIGFSHLHYGVNSAHGLMLAKSAVDKPALFLNSGVHEIHGEKIYISPYNRWPVPVFYLTGVIVDTAGGSIEKQVMAARHLMTFFFVIACVFMTMTLRELEVSLSKAMSAVILTVSSVSYMSYLGVLFNTLPSLTGCAIVAWLMAAHSKGNLNRFTAITLSISAVSLGWEPVAFFVMWFLISIPSFFDKSGNEKFRLAFISCSVAATTVLLMLFGQLWYEAYQLGIDSILDTPSAHSMTVRAGISENDFERTDEFRRFYLHLISRLDTLIIPFTEITGFNVYSLSEFARKIFSPIFLSGGILLICIQRPRYIPVIVGLSLAPFLWYIPMKAHSFAHGFQSMFFLSTASCAWLGFLLFIKESVSRYLLIALIAMMGINGYLFKASVEVSDMKFAQWTKDIDEIRQIFPVGKRVAYVGPNRLPNTRKVTLDLYFYDWIRVAPNNAEFIISTNQSIPGYQRLTDQSHLNLFQLEQ